MTEVEEDTKTEFSFDELDERAKQKARDDYISGDYPGYEWWDYTYEDAVSMGNKIGIYIDHKDRKTHGGGSVREPQIHFSGFCSQGDGACFSGDYRFVPDAVKNIESECNDKELLRIASELTVLQMTRRLLGHDYFSATITTSGRYSHSGTMSVDLHVNDENEDYDSTGQIQEEVQQLMRDFADWIYKNLEAEYDHLTSDEYVDERLAEESFDEDGEIV